jgi:hypothetical protein
MRPARYSVPAVDSRDLPSVRDERATNKRYSWSVAGLSITSAGIMAHLRVSDGVESLLTFSASSGPGLSRASLFMGPSSML